MISSGFIFFKYSDHCIRPVILMALDRFDYFVMVVKCQLISINVAAVAVSPWHCRRLSQPDLIAIDLHDRQLLCMAIGPATATNRWPLQSRSDPGMGMGRRRGVEESAETGGNAIELMLMLDLGI